MPRKIKIIAYVGNGLLAGLFTIIGLAFLFRGDVGVFLFGGLIATLGFYNLYMTWKAAYLLSEEQWLESELRKAEIREQLEKMGRTIPGAAGEQSLPNQDKDKY